MNQPEPGEHLRVDVVISDAAVRESTRILLEVHEFAGSDYASGKAYILAGTHDPDCLLTDRVLSDMTGLELLDHLRTSGDKTPAIMMTGRIDEEMAARARKLSLKLIDKPALTDNLLASIRDARFAGQNPDRPQSGIVAPRFPASFEAGEARHSSWIDNAGTGVAIFDAEHQTLYEIVIDFYDAILAGEPKPVLEELSTKLAAFAADHFAREENYMHFTGYPETDRHAAVHRHLMRQLVDLPVKDVRDDENRSVRALTVLRLLKHWLMDHVLSEDRKLGAYLNAHGIR